jgi:glutamyl-tRNA reductase
MPETELFQHVYQLSGMAVLEHLFRVASGLESMIVGEYEVLGQVSYALEAAEKAGVVHLPLRHIFQSAIRAGRRVREETGISRNAVSVGSAAVELAARAIGKLAGCKMLVIGTGEAGRLVAQAAKDRGISHTVIVGRTMERAQVLAKQLEGMPVSMDNLDEELADTDIVISCSGAPHYTLNVGQVKRAIAGRPGLPLVIIDIAVPRNIEPAVGRIGNVFLYNIDHITGLSHENLKQRENEIARAERIVAEELESFNSWWREFEARPLIKAMMSKAEEARSFHLERTLKKLPALNEEEKHSLEMMTRAIVSKILKDPISNLKANGHDGHNYAEVVRRLFRLEVKD